MFCSGGHLGFPIGIKNRKFVQDIPMIIHVQFGFSQFISFSEDLWNLSQSEHIIGPGSHVEYPTETKNRNFVEEHPMNIPAKFGSNWASGFGEEARIVKSLQTTDDGRQVIWSRWTKKKATAPGLPPKYIQKWGAIWKIAYLRWGHHEEVCNFHMIYSNKKWTIQRNWQINIREYWRGNQKWTI